MISMSATEFDAAVQAALVDVPKDFQPHLENVVIEVRDDPDAGFCAEHDVPDDLLGLYVGVPLDEKGPDGGGGAWLPDRIYVFRHNLCAMCDTHAQLVEEIRITVLHEIGHHFGMDEDQLAKLGYD